ncbi:uncharacterized protein LOC135676259 isoform X1 [Musa acuminata AAA Group]|uniref:uncharacterized protein LOC135676259 isoform X1 n=1 Tax=Musa acuminata AAA Group TaxID=214697 RepID=UPI0031E12DBE
MEHGEDNGEKKLLEAGFGASEVKKQWKNPLQVQILENAYAVAPNPSAAMKEELAKLTGLDYKQVQYWFGNRRYMDRHGPRRYRTRNEGDGKFVNFPAVSNSGLSSSSTSFVDPVAGTESSSSRRNSEMLQHLVPERLAQLFTQMQDQQSVTVHVEKKLGHPLRADGPILGVEFKPLPPGAFGAPLAQQRSSLWPCDGKVTERPTVKSIKAATLLPMSGCCLMTNFSNEGTDISTRDFDALNPDGSPRVVEEYQLFPMQPSWLDSYERVKQAICPLSPANTLNNQVLTSAEGQTVSEYVSAASAFTPQGQLSDSTNQSQQGKQMTISSTLNGHQKAPDHLYRSSASDSQDKNHPATRLDNQFPSSDQIITCNANELRSEKIHSLGSTSDNGNQKHDLTEVQKIVDAKKERDSGVPDVGHGDPGPGGHGQGGEGSSHLQMGLVENHISAVVAFKEVENKNFNKVVMNQTADLPHQVGHWHGYSRYFVKPRERSHSSITDTGDTRVSYFSNTGRCVRPLIAEWNEREKKAVYIDNDNESSLSWSTGSDSTCSDGFDDQATENGRHYAQTNSVDPCDIDIENDDIHKDHNRQEVVDVDLNVEDDEDETDDEDSNMKEESKDKKMEVNEDRRTSPLSSEQTA